MNAIELLKQAIINLGCDGLRNPRGCYCCLDNLGDCDIGPRSHCISAVLRDGVLVVEEYRTPYEIEADEKNWTRLIKVR